MATIAEARMAGIIARPELLIVLDLAERYPASYDRARIMEEADEILDRALAEAKRMIVNLQPVPVAFEDSTGEFAPRIR